jgi:flagellar biosynthetic protein FliQ
MTPQYVITVGREAIYIMLLVSGPMLLAGLVVGIGISILQAVTQIHEVTLTFIPKIIAVTGALILTLPWIMQLVIDFMTRLLMDIPNLAR